MGPKPIRVMLVDDHPLWRETIRAVLEGDGFAEVVAEAPDGPPAVELARTTKPEVVLMDLHLPTETGAEVTRRIAVDLPDVKVLVLSASGDESDVVDAVKAGARGYLLKTGTASEVRDAVERIHKGEAVFTPSLASLVLDEFRRMAGSQPEGRSLAARERRVLELIAEGRSDVQIARTLGMSAAGVKTLVQSTVSKLQSRRERILATVLFTDIVDSTKKAAELGDRRWHAVLDSYYATVRRQLDRHGGRQIGTSGDGVFATFDAPADAIRCASGITHALRKVGIEIRAGLHTGECEVIGEDVGGIAVHIGARVAAKSGPGEILVSSTVKDLLAGSDIEFAPSGLHVLKGVPGKWRLYAVKP